MLTAEMAKAEIETGLSAVCAWCEHWHENKERDCGRDCGGPGSKMKAFPAYKGPWEGNLINMCYICGKEPDAAIELGGGMLGVCKEHLEHFKKMIKRQPGDKLPVVKEQVVMVP
jgi:hypothetical protein